MENVSFNSDKILSDLTRLLENGKITYEQFSEKYDSIVNTTKEIYAKNEETKQLEIREKSKIEASKTDLGKQISGLINNMKPRQPNYQIPNPYSPVPDWRDSNSITSKDN